MKKLPLFVVTGASGTGKTTKIMPTIDTAKFPPEEVAEQIKDWVLNNWD